MTKVKFEFLEIPEDTKGVYIDMKQSIIRYIGNKAGGMCDKATLEAKAKLAEAEGNLEALTNAELEALFTGAGQVMTREQDALYQHVCEKQCDALRQQIKVIEASRLNTH